MRGSNTRSTSGLPSQSGRHPVDLITFHMTVVALLHPWPGCINNISFY
jgi:hypothetical protein